LGLPESGGLTRIAREEKVDPATMAGMGEAAAASSFGQ